MEENRAESNEEPKVNQNSTHEACENWRIKGNEAYGNKNLPEAEDYYTRGLNSVSRDDDTSELCLTALALCYSNRAAVRMSLGRMREALEDCHMAAEIKPDFLKVKVRAANCYLAVGEIKDAIRFFNSAVPQEANLCLDRQLAIEASKGLQQVQKVSEYLNLCAELSGLRISSAVESVLETIDKALLISPYSEKLLEMKADALFTLLKYEETIQLCEHSLDPADKNSPSVSLDDSKNKKSSARFWRWHLMAKCHFYQGRLEESLSFFEKIEQYVEQECGSKISEPSSTLAVTVRELLHHKTLATEASQSGRHLEANEHYTTALALTLESPPFAAICFYNRAATREALGKMREALEDCKKASDIDPSLREVHVIAANCHLALGEIDDALQYYESFLSEESALCLNRRLLIEASNGLQRVKQVADYIDRVGECLRRRTSTDAERALEILAEALLISPYSERLVEMKAEALLMLQKYEEIIQLCEQTLDSATINSPATAEVSEKSENCPTRSWMWSLMAKSYFHLGMFDEFLSCLEKLEQVDSVPHKFGSSTSESLGALAVTVRKLLLHKVAGSEAFQLGKLSEAVDHYTAALMCSQESRPFAALCYRSRAVALQALGKMRAALKDYKKAVEINPALHELQVKAANCHLALGQIDDALQYFNNSLRQGTDLCLDRKLVIEASDGLLKAQQVLNFVDRCDELLGRQSSSGVERALLLIDKALLISPYAEKLVQMKAEALVMLLKYKEMIELCDESLDAADKNYYSASPNSSESITNRPARLWRWSLMAKAYFYLGRLQETVGFLQKIEQAESDAEKFRSRRPESSGTLAVVRELLRHKDAGNEAFQSGRYLEAVEHYTSALSRNLESRPFSAICFLKRAAAYEALGQISDAIADCSFAIALAGDYPKALYRRATLCEMIRDYSNAATDLQRIISEQNCNQSGSLTRSTSRVIDLTEVHSRLSVVKEKAKKGIPVDMYLILGVEPSCKTSDIKKAYRKAALKHHPDKAPLVLPKSENGDNRVWSAIATLVNNDAHVLFKLIGEAYSVLLDPVKRKQYDKNEVAGNW